MDDVACKHQVGAGGVARRGIRQTPQEIRFDQGDVEGGCGDIFARLRPGRAFRERLACHAAGPRSRDGRLAHRQARGDPRMA